MHDTHISIWFFIGISLLVNGVLISGVRATGAAYRAVPTPSGHLVGSVDDHTRRFLLLQILAV
jgi:hypothetical protein